MPRDFRSRDDRDLPRDGVSRSRNNYEDDREPLSLAEERPMRPIVVERFSLSSMKPPRKPNTAKRISPSYRI